MPRTNSRSANFAYMWSRLDVEMTMPDGDVTRRSGHTLSVFRKPAGAGSWRATPTY